MNGNVKAIKEQNNDDARRTNSEGKGRTAQLFQSARRLF
jgi:hypothetical protein